MRTSTAGQPAPLLRQQDTGGHYRRHAQDPFLLFGAHSSLVSGKIAGIAVDDKEAACGLFRRVASPCKYAWLGKQVFDRVPHGGRRPAMRTGLKLWAANQGALQPVMDTVIRTVPGFMTVD